MMIVDIPGSLVISYLGGCFGNSLAAAIIMSKKNITILPKNENFHDCTDWVLETPSEMITMDSDIKLRRSPGSITDIIQVHCLNTLLLKCKFPSSHRVLLTCTPDLEKYAMNRQWKLLNNLDQDQKVLTLSAWDWITYHQEHYDRTGRLFDNDHCLCIDFRKVPESWALIEEIIEMNISKTSKIIYQEHIKTQMEKFYSLHPCFELAWTVYNQQGADAAIEDLVNKEFT